jgi:transposase
MRALILKHLKRIPSYRELERELYRREEYRQACGFRTRASHHSIFGVFRKRLGNKLELLFNSLLEQLVDAGVIKARNIAIDSTHLKAYSSRRRQSDKDASFGHKSKNKVFYGCKAHVLCDTDSELPVTLLVSTGKDNDAKHAVPLLDKAQNCVKTLMEKLLGDAAYYSTAIYNKVIEMQAKPITDYANREQDLPPIYKKRTAVERLFSRAKQLLALDTLTVKGLQAVTQPCYCCLITMLAIAKAAYKTGKHYLTRSVRTIT